MFITIAVVALVATYTGLLIVPRAVGAVCVAEPATVSERKYTALSFNPVSPVIGPLYTTTKSDPVADCTTP